MDNQWVFDLEPKIVSLIKSRSISKLKTEYPKINFTSTNSNTSSKADFPCVYIHMLTGSEIGQDLENTTINAILCSIQIEVYTDTSQADARKVSSVVANEFKKMKFTINQIPEFDNEGTIYRHIMRVKRTIGADDIL